MQVRFGDLYTTKVIERMHLQFMKKLLGVKRTTQNDFIYGEFGRVNYQTHRYYSIKYWTKLLTTDINKYSKKIYLLLKIDCENNIRVNVEDGRAPISFQ